MQERTRISAIIIQNNRILFVAEDKEKLFREPGGRPNGNETHEETLKREIKEELGLDVTWTNFFGEYTGKLLFTHEDILVKNYVYVVSAKWKIHLGHEIKYFVRLSKDDIHQDIYPLLPVTKNQIIPDLIKAGIFI